MRHPVDRLFTGIFLSAGVTLVVMMLLAQLPFGDLDESRGLHILLAVVIAACIVLPRTLLMRTIWRGRDPFILEDELNNMLIGRGIGLVGGAIAGVFVLSQFT
nr:hypothetical protein [uncultured Cupriavidus sp.]